jgi:hypothetical protein
MKINRLIKAFSLLLVVAFTACSDFEDTELLSPVVSDSNPGVRFDNANKTSIEFDLSQDPNPSFVMKINRNKGGSAETYPITVVENEENAFVFPASVSFEANEETTDIVVNMSPTAPNGVTLKYQINFGENVNPYLNEYGEFYGDVILLDWVKYSDGEYTSGFFGDTWDQVLYNAAGTNRYRFFDLFADGYHYDFTWEVGKKDIVPAGTLSGTYRVQESGYVDSSYGMVSTSTDPSVNYTFYNAENNSFYFDRQWNVSAGSFGWKTDIYKITSLAN